MRPLSMLVLLGLTGCGRLSFETRGPDDATPSGTDASDASNPCIVDDGLIAAWPLDTADFAGTTVLDRSGNGRDGTVVGTPPPALVPGRVGKALDFSATTLAYVNVDVLPVDTASGGFNTISLWFRNDNPNVDEGMFCLPAGPTPAPPRYCLWLTNSNGPISLCINGGEGECWGFTDPGLIGRWVHLVGIYANGPTIDGTLYVDGAPAVMGCQFGQCDKVRVAQTPFEIGNSDAVYAWRGLIDDVRVYDRALTSGEVSQLYTCAP